MINLLCFVLYLVLGIVFLGLITTGHMTPILWVTWVVWFAMVWIPALTPFKPIRRDPQ